MKGYYLTIYSLDTEDKLFEAKNKNMDSETEHHNELDWLSASGAKIYDLYQRHQHFGVFNEDVMLHGRPDHENNFWTSVRRVRIHNTNCLRFIP